MTTNSDHALYFQQQVEINLLSVIEFDQFFMPIYEFACPKCRKIFSFFSKRIQPEGIPACPKCGNLDLVKKMSRFAAIQGGGQKDSAGDGAGDGGDSGPGDDIDFDNPRMMRAMAELEKDMAHMDENNPKHMAHMMRKMQQMLPSDAMPKEMNDAIRRLEAGEDPEKIEADMGDVLGDFMGGGEDDEGGMGPGGYGGGFSQDSGLYDY